MPRNKLNNYFDIIYRNTVFKYVISNRLTVCSSAHWNQISIKTEHIFNKEMAAHSYGYNPTNTRGYLMSIMI